LLRSWLFVPGDSPAKMQKAAGVAADVLVVDLEDSVLPQQRTLARQLTAEFLATVRDRAESIFVRVNPVGTADFMLDCRALLENPPGGIMLAKCRAAADVRHLEDVLEGRRIAICPLIESPAGILNAHSIATCSAHVASLAFGAEDFSAEAGVVRTEEEIELLYARSALVTACRAAGREPIDSPCLDYQDLAKTRTSAHRARNLGFTGKLAIHPAQIPVLNEVFLPTEAEIAWARELLHAFAEGGAGTVGLDGVAIDEAVLRRARRMLSLAEGAT
jgi:citrate lyase subunit beta/citryl-CoA lyase